MTRTKTRAHTPEKSIVDAVRIKPGQMLDPVETPMIGATSTKGATTKGASRSSNPQAKRAAAGRFAILNTFVDDRLGVLTGAETKVWLILYRDTKRDGTVCTSQADIARRADLSEKSVQRAVKTLEHRRLLRVIWRGGINQGPSRYRVGGDLV